MFVIKFYGLFILGLVTTLASETDQNTVLQSVLKEVPSFNKQQMDFKQVQTLQPTQESHFDITKLMSNYDFHQQNHELSLPDQHQQELIKKQQGTSSEKNNQKQINTDKHHNQDKEIKGQNFDASNLKSNTLQINKQSTIPEEVSIQKIQGEDKQNIEFSKDMKKELNKNSGQKTVRKSVKITSKLPPIISMKMNKNKVDWMNTQKLSNGKKQSQISQAPKLARSTFKQKEKEQTIKENKEPLNLLTSVKEQNLNEKEKVFSVSQQNFKKNQIASSMNQQIARESSLTLKQKIEQIKSHLVKPELIKSQTNFIYEFNFQYPSLENNENSKVFSQRFDQFVPPVEIGAGSAFSNRLNTQYVRLSSKIPVLQRRLKLKPGKYTIRFDWESDEPQGQLLLFWNHRLMASYKSKDTLANQQQIHIESNEECYKGDNILKFFNYGPIPIGIDNIQVIN